MLGVQTRAQHARTQKTLRMLKKIAVTGPESSGKTTLCRALAKHFNTVWAPEYSRYYLSRLDREYALPDLLAIAKGQLQWQQRDAGRARELLICDTDLVVLKVWSDYRFGYTDPWIIRQLEQNPYDLTLLCYPDIPWEPDPLRENPLDRQELLERYVETLQHFRIPYIEVCGAELQQRLEIAAAAIALQ